MYRAIPPRPDPLVQTVVGGLSPVILALRDRVSRVEVSDADLARLRALQGKAALLLPNHPSESEPGVMVVLSRRVGEPFRFVATHELFTGYLAWLLPRMGVLSIRRGCPDRAALRHCVDALRAGRKLVLFPEGETHLRHDLILPLHRGAAQIALWEAERRRGAGEDDALPVVPILVRYHLTGNPMPAFDRAVRRLESAVGVERESGEGLPARLQRVGYAVLAGVEREYGIAPPGADETVEVRIARVLAHIEGRVLAAVGGGSAPVGDVPTRMRSLFNRVFDFRDGLEGERGEYGRRLDRRRRRLSEALLADLWRVQNFMAIDSAAVPDRASAEQIGEMVSHFEQEVFGRLRTRPWRVARVRVGPALPLEQGSGSRRDDLTRTTAVVEACLRSMLREAIDGS